jgi:hypothetical protein
MRHYEGGQEKFLHIVQNGKKGRPMGAFKSILTQEEILSIYQYLTSLPTSMIKGQREEVQHCRYGARGILLPLSLEWRPRLLSRLSLPAGAVLVPALGLPHADRGYSLL